MQITERLDMGKYFTFDPSKERAIYNWFYYKEGFSPEVTEFALAEEKFTSGTILDPFCGIGTTLLTAKRHGLNAIGFDISPVAVLASRVKCADYSDEDKKQIERFITELKPPEQDYSKEWQFELFPPFTAFPRASLNYLVHARKAIESIENEHACEFLMLALLAIMPMSSLIVKDGGVLKVDKRKMAMPAKEALRRKVKKMLNDLAMHPITGPVPRIEQADARVLPLEDNTVDLVVTSPPYLNNVDYTKVYGLEISLLYLDKGMTKQVRGESLRSFITSNEPPGSVPPEIGDIGYKIPVIGNYFSDLDKVIAEVKRVLKPGKACYLVIGNSVVYGTEIYVDELLGSMAERMGMQADIIIGAERIADVKPRKVKIRESIIVMRK